MNQRKTPEKTLEEGTRTLEQETLGQVPTMRSGGRGTDCGSARPLGPMDSVPQQGRKKVGKGPGGVRQSWAPQSVFQQQECGHHLGAWQKWRIPGPTLGLLNPNLLAIPMHIQVQVWVLARGSFCPNRSMMLHLVIANSVNVLLDQP